MCNLYAHGFYQRSLTLRYRKDWVEEVAELKLMYCICRRLTSDIKQDILSQWYLLARSRGVAESEASRLTLNRRWFLLSGASCVEGYKVMIKLISPRFTISQWSLIEAWNMAVEEFWMVKWQIFIWWSFIYIISRHVTLYNMSRFHDNTVFQIVEK